MDYSYLDSPTGARSASDEEASSYATINSAPPKRRAGRTKFRETRHPVFKGVRQRNSDKWVCELREPNKKSRIWLGTFPTAEMAARAHDVAAIALRGRSACLNFADSAYLPQPKSTSPKDIQKAAAEAAESFRPSSGQVDSPVEMQGVYNVDVGSYDFGSPAAAAAMFSPPQSPVWCSSEGPSYWDEIETNTAEVSLWSYSI